MQIVNPSGCDNPDLKAPLAVMAESADRLEAAKGEKLLALVRHLEAQGPAPRAIGRVALGELWLSPSGRSSGAFVRVWLDWPDYGPAQDGLPVMHYRIQVRRPGSSLSADARVQSPQEVEQVISEAFGWAG
jgi:hypothetical protein